MKKITVGAIFAVMLSFAGCALESGMNGAGGYSDEALKVFGITGYGEGTQVKLYYAKAIVTGADQATVKGFIEVAPLSAGKQVSVHYSTGGEWADVPATYVCPGDDGKEMWQFAVRYIPFNYGNPLNFRFAVKVVSDGVTYWDNNGEQDYVIGDGDYYGFPKFAWGKSVVALDYAYYTAGPAYNPYPPQFSGTVFVKDLAYDKLVQVVYTTNDWADVLTLNADYQFDKSDSEQWMFNTTFTHSVSQIKFALSYTVCGFTAWDNNFRRDYVLNCPGSIETK